VKTKQSRRFHVKTTRAFFSRVMILSLLFGAFAESVARAEIPAHAGTIVLQFWHSMSGEKSRLLQSITDDFNALPANQGVVKVEPQFVGDYEEGLNKLRTALIGGRGPHVVQITDVGQRAMIDSGAIAPLQDFIDHDPEFPIALIIPAIRRYYEVKGRLYSLPFATSNPILYYNADAFQKAGITHSPQTYAELEEDARKLTDLKTRTTGITWPLNSWFFEEFMAREGANFANPDNGRTARAKEANYLAPEGIAFMSLWSRMVKAGTFANVGRGWDPAEQNFLAGRSAMLITSTSDIFEVMKQAPFKLGTGPIPSQNKDSKGGTVVGGNSLWILKNKSEAEQNASYQFLKFMASAAVQEKWHTNTGYFPIRSDVIDSLKKQGFYERNPAAWTAIKQLRASPNLVATEGALLGVFPEAREHIATAIEEVLSGQSDVLTSLKKAKAKSDFSLLRYNRGKPDETTEAKK
jgi:sn-glycerol 3-phosphate transport system substrate-binding protein